MKKRDKIIALVLVLGFIVGVALIVSDLNSNSDDNNQLQIEGTSAAEISELTGLVFADNLDEFRSALSETGEQVDIRFVATKRQVDEFISASGLPPLVPERRLLTHSSPVWDLNPVTDSSGASTVTENDADESEPSRSDLLEEFNPTADLGQATLHLFSSTSDRYEGLVRVVEVVDLGDDNFEVRVSVTSQSPSDSLSDVDPDNEDGE